MGFLGNLVSTKGTNQGSNQGSSRAVWDDPNANKTLQRMLGQPAAAPTEVETNMRGLGNQSVTQGLAENERIDVQPQLDAIKANSAAQLPVALAQSRSQFYNKPVGRNEIAQAETIGRNFAERDQNLAAVQTDADKFNAGQGNEWLNRLSTVGARLQGFQDPTSVERDRNDALQLQLLNMMRGENTTGSQQGVQRNRDTPLKGIGAGIGAIGAAMMCWVARAAYGEDDFTWIVFREWMLTKAPKWFVKLYIKFGPAFAEFIKSKPKLRALVRWAMNFKVRSFISN